jgi:hypothetical protein
MDQRLFFLKSHTVYGAVHTAGQFYMVPELYAQQLIDEGIAESEAQHEVRLATDRLRDEMNRQLDTAVDVAQQQSTAEAQQNSE